LDTRLLVLEASSGWEVLAASSLAEAGLPVAVANPSLSACLHKLPLILNALIRQHATWYSPATQRLDSQVDRFLSSAEVPI